MKIQATLALLLSASTILAAEQAATAYTALRVVGKQNGADSLNRVVEMRGRNGSPQPAVWKVVLSEPSARGGIREIEVQRGRIISERSPVARGAVGEKMDFSRLNLDSEGVFTVVDGELKKAGQLFDRLDYSLRSGSGGGAPVWTVEIYDGRRGRIGSMLVAADSGAVLERSINPQQGDIARDREYVRDTPPPVAQRDNDNVYRGGDNVYRGRDPQPQERQYTSDGQYSQPGEPFRSVTDFFHRFGKRVVRHGEHLENFFTGKRGEQAYER